MHTQLFSLRNLLFCCFAAIALFVTSCSKDQFETVTPVNTGNATNLAAESRSALSVDLLPGYYTTGNEYEKAAISSIGDMTVVAFQKPTGEIRLASYKISTTGGATLKDIIDFEQSNYIHLAMLTETRVVVAIRSNANVLKTFVFNLHSTTGVFSLKDSHATTYTMATKNPSVARLSSNTFVTGMILSGSNNMRYTTWAVSTAGDLTKRDDIDGGYVSVVEVVALSSTRFVASIEDAADRLKIVCFDIIGNTIYRRGDHIFNEAARRISATRTASNRLAVFSLDNMSRLSARTLELSSLGNIIEKDTDDNIVSPDNNQPIVLTTIDAQMTSTGQILLSGIKSGYKHTVIPFGLGSTGTIFIRPGAYNANDFGASFATTVEGKLVVASRQMNNKYRIASYKYQ
jgi:predicted small integral membrane protein